MTTKKRTEPEQQVDVPSQLLDAYGNPSMVSAGQIIESAWGNSVAGRVVNRYTNFSTLPTSAPNASIAITTDTNTVWVRNNTTWQPTAMGVRVWFRGVGFPAGQNLSPSVAAPMSWAVDSDPFGVLTGGSVFTVPANWAGRWKFEWAVQFAEGGAVGVRLAYCTTTRGRLGEMTSGAHSGGTRVSGSGSMILSAGETANITMYHTDTVDPLNCNPSQNQYFQGYYLGPN